MAQLSFERFQFASTIGLLALINFLVALDSTILSVALPYISQDLGGTATEAFWCGTSYLLAATVLQPSTAAFSDVFGRKPLIFSTIILFGLGSVLAAIAQNFTVLLLGRTVQGIGGGGFSAMTNIVLTDILPLRERGKWLSFIMLFWAFGCAIAPVIGGAVTEYSTWRWIYWMNLPICGIAISIIPTIQKLQKPLAGLRFSEKLKRLDWFGNALFIATTSTYLIGLSWGGLTYPWSSWRTLVPLILGLIGNLFFALWEVRVKSPINPVLPPEIFQTATSLTCYYGLTMQGLAMGIVVYYVPIFFEACKGWSATRAGIGLFPWTFTSPPSSIVVGILISHYGTYRWGINLGFAIIAAGVGLLVLYKPWTSTATWVPIALVSGIGVGLVYPPLSICNQAAVRDKRHLPAAAALTSFWRNYGQMLGVTIGGNVLQNRLRVELSTAGSAVAADAKQLSRDASAFVAQLKSMTHYRDAITRRIYVWAFSESLHWLWYVTCGMSGLAFLLSVMFIKHYSLAGADDFVFDKEARVDIPSSSGTCTSETGILPKTNAEV